jgi:hypothetical protein
LAQPGRHFVDLRLVAALLSRRLLDEALLAIEGASRMKCLNAPKSGTVKR